jgi:hypothetical protein
MTISRAAWDFPYQPARKGSAAAHDAALDVVVATLAHVDATSFAGALEGLGAPVSVETLVARAPLFWTRVRSSARATPNDVAARLSKLGVRYVASAQGETMLAAPALAISEAQRARPSSGGDRWTARLVARTHPESTAGGRWFLGDGGGVVVDRRVCGTGAGTRLAVIDNETADLEHLELDGVVHVGVESAPATTGHAALMVAWSTGAAPAGGTRFVGVAPDASVRLYCIPKPGVDVVSLPLAIAKAVFDGADVVVCATYVEGTVSPMLDDALDVATHLGRRGRGTPVVLPTGRETASPGDSIHASLSLGLGDPASDARIHCIAPGGRGGGWFLWRNARGKIRPFSNRGPAVRWMTPGDDISYPFSSRDRLFHSESSGASAIAAGVILLVLGCNPRLHLHELHAVLARTVDAPSDTAVDSLVDPADILPTGYDPDGHSAKSGYGRLNATRACSAARDPIALELVAMGHDDLAVAWCRRRRPYSRRAARWAVRRLLTRPDLAHGVRILLRHVRLVAAAPSRGAAHARGAWVRELAIVLRELWRASPPAAVRDELARMLDHLTDAASVEGHAAMEHAARALFRDVDRTETPATRGPILSATLRS